MKKLLVFFCTICLLTTTVMAVSLDVAVEETGHLILDTVPNPQVASVGGEWAVIGLARWSYDVPQSYWDSYYQTVVDAVVDCQGNLHDKKNTEYSRVILALTAIGADPTNVGGYNLLTPLGDYDQTVWQGVNGAIWALIALDSGSYDLPENSDAQTHATRQMYIDDILDSQLSDGGWSLSGANATSSDPDITGMALQALAPYRNQDSVNVAIETALDCISEQQDSQGGFASWGTANVESNVQILVGLSALGIRLDDANFVKNGNTILDNLLMFRQKNGGFNHTLSGAGDSQMSTEQGFYAMVAVQRAENGESNLYQMDDVTISVTGVEKPTIGLAGKHEDVTSMPVMDTEITFPDIADSCYVSAILELASRSIINGSDDGNFYPDDTMTRAEFAKIVVSSLGLPLTTVEQFEDVSSTDWFAPYVGAAYTYGIVNGTSATTFTPQGTITRQEAAVMVARAATLCGMDTTFETVAIRDTLAGFTDYVTVAEFAQSGVAFCYEQEILDPSVMEIHPEEAVTRGEVAQMLYQLLDLAQLL